MPTRKLRVEVFDEKGNRYTVTLEGKITREKALCLLDVVELLGGVHDKDELRCDITSKFNKIKLIIEENFPFSWFSSKEILEVFEKKFNEQISLSTVSTYLARMTDRGFITKRGSSYNREYRTRHRKMTELAQNTMKL
ncbi:MAG: hypothetical protein JSV51_04455 [Candidatus Bathyarchaeota archaeon]|nr:MAG: hypothetical protein JSV51_04455 [Candidatus Bathyarchaeota archaeon]